MCPQLYVTPSYRGTVRTAWGIVATIYTGIAVLHLLLVTRPGYSISLSQVLRLPAIFRASSCRSAPTCWVAGALGVSWGSWIRQVLVWSVLQASKWLFEFYLLSKQLAKQVRTICDITLFQSTLWRADNDFLL